VTQATNGNFYGTTLLGGTNNLCGTIFQITTTGQLTTLHNFNQSDGCSPIGPMIQGTDGNFYGTAGGGAHGRGVIFKIDTPGKFTRVYSFCSQAHCADGVNPSAHHYCRQLTVISMERLRLAELEWSRQGLSSG